jgi:hypothetical protein
MGAKSIESLLLGIIPGWVTHRHCPFCTYHHLSGRNISAHANNYNISYFPGLRRKPRN